LRRIDFSSFGDISLGDERTWYTACPFPDHTSRKECS